VNIPTLVGRLQALSMQAFDAQVVMDISNVRDGVITSVHYDKETHRIILSAQPLIGQHEEENE
jgi:hypothetical protein